MRNEKAVILYKTCGALIAFMLLLTVFTTRHYAYMPGLAGIAGMFAIFFENNTRPVLPKRLFILLASFVVLGLASSLWSVNPAESLERALKAGGVFTGGAIFITFCLSCPTDIAERPAKLLAMLVPLLALVLFMELYLGMPMYKIAHGIPAESFVNKYELNKETATLVFLLPAALTITYLYNRPWAAVLMLIPFVALLLTTVSQAAQIAFLTGFAAFVLFPAKARILRIAFGILLVSGITASPWIAPVMFDTLADLFLSNRFLIEASASSRLEIWDAVSGKIMEKPVTGYGMYSSRFIDDFDIKKLYYTSGTVMHPHNAALQLWLEFGIPGAVAANAAVLYFLNVCYKSDMRAIRIYFSLFSMLLTVSLLGWGLWQAWWLGAVFASSGFIIIAGRLLMSSRTEHC